MVSFQEAQLSADGNTKHCIASEQTAGLNIDHVCFPFRGNCVNVCTVVNFGAYDIGNVGKSEYCTLHKVFTPNLSNYEFDNVDGVPEFNLLFSSI